MWAGSRPYNQNTSVDMTDAKIPLLTTLKKITPATYPTTAAGNNPAWTADVTSAGTLRITVGGQRAEVEFAGVVSPGLYQFNLVLPDLPAGDHAVVGQHRHALLQTGQIQLTKRSCDRYWRR